MFSVQVLLNKTTQVSLLTNFTLCWLPKYIIQYLTFYVKILTRSLKPPKPPNPPNPLNPPNPHKELSDKLFTKNYKDLTCTSL